MQDTVQIDERYTVAKFAPDEDQLRQAREEGFRSVVNMQTEGEKKGIGPEKEEKKAEEAGLTYLHYPVDGEKLSNETVDGFRSRLGVLPSPVLIHCASGKRSGAMVMMHIGSEHRMTGEQVVEKAEEMGFECDTPELENLVKNYVNSHGNTA